MFGQSLFTGFVRKYGKPVLNKMKASVKTILLIVVIILVGKLVLPAQVIPGNVGGRVVITPLQGSGTFVNYGTNGWYGTNVSLYHLTHFISDDSNVQTNRWEDTTQSTWEQYSLFDSMSWQNLADNFRILALSDVVTIGSSLVVTTNVDSLSQTFTGTNGIIVGNRPANSNAVSVTNFVGAIHTVAAATMFFNAAQAGEWLVTNRIGAVTSCIITNSAAGKSLTGTLIGEVSGGSSRVVTLIPDLGHLVSNLDDYSGVLATSFSFTLTNGNAVEWSDEVRKLNGTNIHKIVTRQFKF